MRTRLRAWLAVFAGWTALALLLAVSASLTYRTTGRPANWSLTISRGLAEWWLWAALTPLAVGLARRYPLEGTRRGQHLLIHLCAGLVVALAKTLADRAVFAMISGFRIYVLFSTIALQFVVYVAIVTATHGFEFYRRSREREVLERRLAETRLQLLGMQLQPHFLFNTLNTIAELVHHDADTADDMIVGLSELLRLTLQLENRQQITLREELALLSKYLDIQRARFGDRLRTTVAIPDEVQDALVPALFLQPLVENSIRHGLATLASAGRIDIHARRQDGRLLIEIVDDGSGTVAAALPIRQGLGFANTRARMEALHGSECRLEFTPLAGGACVRIEMPLRTDGAAV
jgi:two-component system, LytTR family, sensor kinase